MNTRVDPHSSGIAWIPLPPNPINQGGDKVNKAINNIAGLFHKHGIPFDQVRGGSRRWCSFKFELHSHKR